jgi:hypothetical protein
MQASQEMDQELMGKQAEGQNTMKYAKSNKPRLLASQNLENVVSGSAEKESKLTQGFSGSRFYRGATHLEKDKYS